MSPTPIRIGFVGLSSTGWASTALAPAMFRLKDNYIIKAVSTTSPESAKASADKYSDELGHTVKQYFGDTSHIANDPEIDMIVLAVKAPSHLEAVLPVIAAGKDFFLEWPAGRNLQETTAIADASRKKGVKSMVGLQARHSPALMKVESNITSPSLPCFFMSSFQGQGNH